MIIKTDAIVLRARKLRETSRFLTLYTEMFGKIDVVAKGVRTQKSKLRGVLEPFNDISAVIYRKEQRNAQYLSDAEIITQRRTLTTNYEKLSAAFAVAELTDTVMHHEEKNPAMFALLRETLDAFDRAEHGTGSLFVLFQWKLINVLGFNIQMHSCAQCGKSLQTERVRWFSPANGGFHCEACGRGASVGTKISDDAYNLLIRLEHTNAENEIGSIALSPRAESELRGMFNAYILHHTESRAVLRAGALMVHSGRQG